MIHLTHSTHSIIAPNKQPSFDLLGLLRRWINHIEIKNPSLARFICRLIPCSCPFERDVSLLGHIFFHIPPLCKLNPVYDELVALRFRALTYLADSCGEDITPYLDS